MAIGLPEIGATITIPSLRILSFRVSRYCRNTGSSYEKLVLKPVERVVKFSRAPRRLDGPAVANYNIRQAYYNLLFSLLSSNVQWLSTIERFNCKLRSIETGIVPILGVIVAPRYRLGYRDLFYAGIETLVLTILIEVSKVSHNTRMYRPYYSL